MQVSKQHEVNSTRYDVIFRILTEHILKQSPMDTPLVLVNNVSNIHKYSIMCHRARDIVLWLMFGCKFTNKAVLYLGHGW